MADELNQPLTAVASHLNGCQRLLDRGSEADLTIRIARSCGWIVIGDVSASKLARTTMAKSVLDQGWSDFAGMLRDKAMGGAGILLQVNEANTTRTCSACQTRCGPKGIAGLRIRGWECSACGTVHDRDLNAATNILRLGHEALAGGSPAL